MVIPGDQTPAAKDLAREAGPEPFRIRRGLPVNVGFRGRLGRDVLAGLPGVAASTGSACHEGSMHISPVLAEMGVPHDVALGAVRFSLGRGTTRDEIDAVVERLTAAGRIRIRPGGSR